MPVLRRPTVREPVLHTDVTACVQVDEHRARTRTAPFAMVVKGPHRPSGTERPMQAFSFHVPRNLHGLSFRSDWRVARYLKVCRRSTSPGFQGPLGVRAGVFDFLRNFGEQARQEQQALVDAVKQGKFMDYVRDKAVRDAAQVSAFREGLTKTRERLSREIETIVERNMGRLDQVDQAMQDIENALLGADLGVSVVDRLMENLRKDIAEQRLRSGAEVRASLAASLLALLTRAQTDAQKRIQSQRLAAQQHSGSPQCEVLMLVGTNGHGKTTSAAKLAYRLRTQDKKKVLLVAADTFRAAAVQQLAEWAQRAGVDIAMPLENQKSAASVAYDALKRAVDERYDVAIIDTSGRLHTNENLMEEMKKLRRVVERQIQGPLAECLLVLDAPSGRNAVAAARQWLRDVQVTGLVLTKLDGTARAGFLVSVVEELGIPVKFVGVGEKLNDLRDFDPVAYVNGLLLSDTPAAARRAAP
jgi:fused signal recognition particle receptor